MKSKHFISIGILILFTSVISNQVSGNTLFLTELTSHTEIQSTTLDFENVVFITWDGTNYKALEDLINDGTLVNTKRVDDVGYRQTVRISSHLTSTGAGLACSETGYGPEHNLIPYNMFGAPEEDKVSIPDGMTVGEKLKNVYGDDITNIFVFSWQTGEMDLTYINQNPMIDPIYDNMKEDFDVYFASESLNWTPSDPEARDATFHGFYEDVQKYQSPVMRAEFLGNKAADFLANNVTTDRFFLRIHLTEPDQAGHGYGVRDTSTGEYTPEYRQSLIDCDIATGMILDELENMDVLNETLIIIGADHGMYHRSHDGGVWPVNHPEITSMTFIINDDAVQHPTGLPVYQRDVVPTILASMGINTAVFSPSYDGGDQEGQPFWERTDTVDPIIYSASYQFLGQAWTDFTTDTKLTETFNLSLITFDWDNTLNGVLEVDDLVIESDYSRWERVNFFNIDVEDFKSGKSTFHFTVTDSSGNSSTFDLVAKVSAPIWFSIIGVLVVSSYIVVKRRRK